MGFGQKRSLHRLGRNADLRTFETTAKAQVHERRRQVRPKSAGRLHQVHFRLPEIQARGANRTIGTVDSRHSSLQPDVASTRAGSKAVRPDLFPSQLVWKSQYMPGNSGHGRCHGIAGASTGNALLVIIADGNADAATDGFGSDIAFPGSAAGAHWVGYHNWSTVMDPRSLSRKSLM